jgi:predicted nucleic acid-binding protein
VAAYFFDSSGIVKRYAAELGSAWVQSLTAPAAGHEAHLARITGVEVVSALVRHSPPLTPPQLALTLAAFRHDFRTQYQLLEVSPGLVLAAMHLAEKHRLRGYDAVQLAGALELHGHYLARGQIVTFVSADGQLNAAATAEGLAVDDPTTHP